MLNLKKELGTSASQETLHVILSFKKNVLDSLK